MSPFWDWFVLLAGTAGHLIANYYGDIVTSRLMTKEGIKEKFWLASGDGGMFVEWKGWLLKLVPVALIWSAFMFFPESDSYADGYWDRFWAGFIFIPAIIVSIVMYFHNWKKITNRRNRNAGRGIL